jgi:uncharacterized protein
MPFNLFRKNKQPEEEKTTMMPQEEPKQEELVEPNPVESHPEPAVASQEPFTESELPIQNQPQPTDTPPAKQQQEIAEKPNKAYLKAMPLKELSDLENIKSEVRNGNIIILKVTPLAAKSIEDVKNAVNELFLFAESLGGDIARLGEERVVICPKTIRIWREKTPKPASNEALPTAA